MLHLAVIGIVCAVSAPVEGTAFINRKNNASNVFSHFDGGEKNVVSLPNVYDVVVDNYSECAGQKITNRTSSFFYEYIIKQYRDSKNSSCSIMDSASSGQKNRFRSNLSFPYRRKRSSLSREAKPLSTKTLRPPLDNNNKEHVASQKELCKNESRKWHRKFKSDLNCNEKKLLFRLTHPLQGKKKTYKGCKRHLDRLKVDDELDLNKRIEKLVKQIALENQRKENSARELTLSDGFRDDYIERSPFKDKAEKSSSFPFFNHIKKIFSFSKNYFNNKIVGVNSVPIDSARGKALASEKAAHISSYDLLKNMRKTTRFRRNPNTNHLPYRYSGNTVYKNELTEKSYPHSTHFKRKRHFKRRRTIRKFIPDRRRRKLRNMKRRKARRRGKKVKNWPLYKNHLEHDLRLRRDGSWKSTVNSNERSATQRTVSENDFEVFEDKIPSNFNKGPGNKGVIPLNNNEYESSSLLISSEETTDSTEDTINGFNIKEGDIHQHTLERPFLEGNLIHSNSRRPFHSGHNPMTEDPLYSPIDFRLASKYKYELPNEAYLTPERYLQIRHALRSYLVHNNVFTPVKRTISPERSKRCGKCSKSRKCWRSPPLLCIPYIKKGQEDQLRYLIRIMQSMIGKPFPPKVDIFDRTKFKPDLRKEKEDTCDYSEDDDYADYPCESTYNSNPYTNSAPTTCAPPPTPLTYPPVNPLTASPTIIPLYPPITCPSTFLPSSPSAFGSPRPVSPQQMYDSFTPTSTGQECTFTESPLSAELPFSFPVLGQGADQTTSCNFDDFTTSQSLTATPFCHTPMIPTGPIWSSPPPSSIKPPPPEYSTPPTGLWSSTTGRVSPPTPVTPCKKTTNPSSVKVCAGVSSDVPVEQKEYFSFAALSYNGGPRCATETYRYSESVTSRPQHTQPPPFPLCNTNQKYYPQRTVCEGCYTTPHVLPITNALPRDLLRTPPPLNFMTSPATQKFQHQMLRQMKGHRKQFHPEHILGSPYVKYDQRNRKPLNNPLKNAGVASPTYEDQFNPPTESSAFNAQMKYEIAQNRLFRMHHKENPKHNYQAAKTVDYDFYDRYPHENPKQKEIRFSKRPPPRSSWNEYDQEPKKVEKRSKSTRHKRGDDYYSWPEGLENYNDYLDDNNYGDEHHREIPVKFSDTWTPPSYDMFRELAKAVTYTSTITPSNTSTTASDGKNFTNTLVSDSSTTRGFEIHPNTITKHHTPGKGDTPLNDHKSISGHAPENTTTTIAKSGHNITPTTHTSIQSQKSLKANTTPHSHATESDWVPDASDIEHPTTTEDPKRRKTVFFPSNTKKISGTTSTTENSYGRGDDSKRRKTAFFPSNTKTTGAITTDIEEDGSNGDATTPMNVKRSKGLDENDSVAERDGGQMPTTLKMASIAKGQKKLVTKPSPKVYNKVYPESLTNQPEANGTTVKNRATTATTIGVKTTSLQSSTSTTDVKLQILAVCEGYLEVIKVIKAQNRTAAQDLDMDLARYCENIISQSFNYQLDKSKKPDNSESSSQLSVKFDDNPQKMNTDLGDDIFENDITDTTDDYVGNEEPGESVKKEKSKRKKTRKNLEATATENKKSDKKVKPDSEKKKKRKKKKKRRKSHSSSKRQDQQQQGTEDADEVTTRGVGQEQIELIKLLRRRKKALLSWLLSSRDQDKAGDMQETEYFDDDDLMDPDIPQDSGTVKPKRDERTSGTTEKKFSFVNESIFPVYAKQYGYDSGGEVREVEVLWRKINEKTHEKKIFKNVSVLALLLTSTNEPDLNREETKLVGSNGYDNEEISEIQFKNENKINFAAVPPAQSQKTTPSVSKILCPSACNVTNTTEQTNSTNITKSPRKNATHTFITKPDVATILGKPPKMNKTHPNTTHKVSHRFGAAKDLFQEYSIEFLDYAVYILPIMFTILFLFCCLCCAVHIFHTGKTYKKKKKKKKIPISSDETTETTEESEFESKKRKREAKRKRKSKEGSDGTQDCRRGKKFWNVLKLHPHKPSSETNESNQTEKKRSFLRFLKGKRDEDKTGNFCHHPLSEVDETAKHSHDSTEGKHSLDSDEKPISRGRKKEEEKHKTDGGSEAAERRELIALLEELKKIETEHTEEKKEVKSVHVQYMTQEDENVFQRPNFSYPYEKNVFGLPKGYSFYSKQLPFQETEPRGYELYDGVNELTELLPCECSFYSKRNDYCDFRINQGGRCKRFLNVFRDSGVSRNKPVLDKNCRKNESENRTFIFNKYRSISTDESDGLLGVTYKNAGTEVRFQENASPFAFGPRNHAELVEEMENFKRQLNNKKNVRLKDDGVLCRL